MVTGRTVFEADTPVAVILKHVNEPAPDARQVNPKVSEGCAKVIGRLLRKDPARRPQTPAELVKLLDAVLAGEPVKAAPAAERRRPPTSRVPPSGEKSRTTLYIGIGIAAAVIVIGALMFTGGKKPERRPAFERPVSERPVAEKPAEVTKPAEEKPAEKPLEKHTTGGPESMLGYLKAWEKTHLEDYDELLDRYEKVKKAAEGTASEFRIADQVDAAVAAVKERRQKAADTAWATIETAAAAKTETGDYDGALAELANVPAKFQAQLEQRAKTRADGLRKEAEGKIASAVKLARGHLKATKPEEGLKALAAAEKIKYAAGTGGVAKLKAELTEQKNNIGEIRAKEAASKAEERLAAVLAEFTRAVVEKKDVDAARAVVRKAKGTAELKPLAEKVNALAQVADAMEEVRRLEREAIGKLAGKKVDLKTKSGRRVKGTVQKVQAGTIYVEMKVGGAEATLPLKMSDLSDEQKEQFRGKYVPTTDAQKIAAALGGIAGGDLSRAGELIEQAQSFPLAAHYGKKVRELKLGAENVAAEEAWADIEEFVERHKKNLDKAGGKRLLAMLTEFEETNLATESGAPHKERLEELKEWAGNAVVGFDIKTTFKGKVESYDPDTRAITLLYDWEDEAQLEDWESLMRVNAAPMTDKMPWTDNVVITHERWGGRLRKKHFAMMTANTKAAFTGDIEFSYDYEGRGGHAELMYKPAADTKGWQAVRVINPNSHGFQLVAKVGVCIFRKAGFGYRNIAAPAEKLLPSNALDLEERPSPAGIEQARYVLKVEGRKITWSVNGKAHVSSWTPECSKDIFPEERAEQRPAVYLHMHMRTQDVSFDNIRIKGTLSAEWIKKIAAEYRNQLK
jgi:hypothetical protein